MTQEQFIYWLQGFMEVQDPKTLDEKQVQIIKDHLALVFTKVTPDYKDFKVGENIKMPDYRYPDNGNIIIC